MKLLNENLSIADDMQSAVQHGGKRSLDSLSHLLALGKILPFSSSRHLKTFEKE